MVILIEPLARVQIHASLFSATKMTGRPGHWSEPGEYNILFLGSILVISSQDSSALGYREFTQEGAMTISPFAAREGTNAPQWPNVRKCCRHLVPSSDFFVQSYAVPIFTSFKFKSGPIHANNQATRRGPEIYG